MKLSLNMILLKFPYDLTEKHVLPVDQRRIQDIRFADSAAQQIHFNHLYIGYANTFLQMAHIPDQSSIICIGKLNPQEPVGFHYVSIAETHSLSSLFNELQDIFLQYNIWERSLHSMLEKQMSLNQFLEVSSDIIGYPMDIIDVNEGTLAATTSGDLDDIVWREVREGFIHEDTRSNDSIKADEIIKNIAPVQFFSSISKRYLLTKAIRIQHHVIGFISAHMLQEGSQTFAYGTIQQFDFLTRFIEHRMDADDFHKLSRGWVFEYMLPELIEGRMSDSDIIKSNLKMIDFCTDGKKVLVVIRSRQRHISDHHLDYLFNQLESMYPKFRGIVYKGCLIMIDFSASIISTSSTDALFVKWLNSNQMLCGVSNTFENLVDTSAYYTQAERALFYGCICAPQEYIYFYCNYSVQHSYEMLASQMDLRELIHPYMRQILSFLQKTPFLLDTLRAYLRNERNVRNASKELFVHKNTMVYRLKVIQEKIDCDLDNPEIRHQLLHSIEVLDYMQQFMGYDILTGSFASPEASE